MDIQPASCDLIPAEALKVDIDTSVKMLDPLLVKIWENKVITTMTLIC